MKRSGACSTSSNSRALTQWGMISDITLHMYTYMHPLLIVMSHAQMYILPCETPDTHTHIHTHTHTHTHCESSSTASPPAVLVCGIQRLMCVKMMR